MRFFQLDDAVEAPQQFEAPIGLEPGAIGGLLDLPAGQVRRLDTQRACTVQAGAHTGERPPQLAALAPGDATGFRTAEDLGRPLAEVVAQLPRGGQRQGATGGKYPAHAAQCRPVEVVTHAFEQRRAGYPGKVGLFQADALQVFREWLRAADKHPPGAQRPEHAEQ